MTEFKKKRFHFIGNWKNGDPLVISSFGYSKKDAWCKMLKARKDKKFKYNKGDGFSMKYVTEEELGRKNKNFFKYGHTTYIVDGDDVEIN